MGWIPRHAVTASCNIDLAKKRIQNLTKSKQNPSLRGVKLEEGFPLGTTK